MTARVSVQLEFALRFHNISRDQFDALTGEVMTELLNLEECTPGLTDSAVSAMLSDRLMEIDLVATAGSFDDAAALGDSSIRAALHAVGAMTPEWDQVKTSAELV